MDIIDEVIMDTLDEQIQSVENALDFCELLIDELVGELQAVMSVEFDDASCRPLTEIEEMEKRGFFTNVMTINQKLTILKEAQEHLADFHDDLLEFYDNDSDGGIGAELDNML